MFGYIGSMKAVPGKRDEVVAILVEGADALKSHGCEAYVVNVSSTDDDAIWVFEIWQTKHHHAASLELPATKAAIARAMPLLTGEFTSRELDVVGGLGVSPAT